MHRAINTPSFQKLLRLPALFMVLGLFVMLFFVAFGNVGVALADGIPGGNVTDPVVRAVDIAKPAVVRIFTIVSGHLTVNFSPNSNVTFPQSNNQSYQLQLSGSGTFISANGDILTADHVVNPPDQVMQEAAAQDVATYINKHPGTGLGQVSSDQAKQLLETGQLKSSATFDFKKSEAFLSTDYTGPLTATDLNQVPSQDHMPIDRIEKESAVNQRDVAIVHAGFTDTPSVSLGDSSAVQQQDQLTIVGFPGNGDVSNLPTDLLTSSINTITVSSIKTTDNGAPLIQVGGNVEQGDSGGPALNNQGTVVGVVSFGVASTAGSTNFLQASNSARDLVQSLSLDTTPGNFQKQWSQAFTDYSSNSAGHWHKSAQELQKLSTTYPQFKAVSKYLDYAQQQAQSEKPVTATPTTNTQPAHTAPMNYNKALLITIGAGVVLVLLVLLLFGVAVRNRRKKKERTGMIAPSATPLLKSTQAQSQSAPQVVPQQNKGFVPANVPVQKPMAPAQQVPQAVQKPSVTSVNTANANNANAQSSPQTTAVLRMWPCGHMNRPNARFCSICGEPAPEPPTIRRPVQP